MANAKVKTNAMRILDKAKVNYNLYNYDSNGEAVDGVSVAHCNSGSKGIGFESSSKICRRKVS